MRMANVDGRATLLLGDECFDVASMSEAASDPMLVLEHHWLQATELAQSLVPGTGHQLRPDQLCAPVPRPGAIFGVVANYPPAIAPTPRVPMVFGKFPSAVVGPYDNIVLPDPTRLPMGTEWTVLEAELAVVVGSGGRHIRQEHALERIAGFTVAQDITERVHEFGPTGTSVGTMDYLSLKALGKSLDTFCPLGPAIVTPDEFDDPLQLDLECRLNGRIVQQTSTAELLIGVPELVSFLSAFVTLRPGDVILTGTPTPADGQLPRLMPGDLIETTIAGIGTLRNRCIAET
ncbi:MAG: fumarylacetoacetate hydrolase family protein [Mycobacterium sp.]|nr:fumarylacetoacetate hydrolase family protein [Mycobacterium sp.]